MLQFIYDIWEKTVDGCISYLSTLTFPPWFDTISEGMTSGLQTLNYFFPIHTMLIVVTWCFGITVVAIVTKFILSVLKII